MLSNSEVKRLTSFKQKKYRDQEKRFLVEGVRLCEELTHSTFEVERLIYSAEAYSAQRSHAVIKKNSDKGIVCTQAEPKQIAKISDTVSPQGIVAIAVQKKESLQSISRGGGKLIVALLDLRDPGNIGAILRTASWFGVDGLLLCGNSIELYNPKVVRASMGAIFHLPVVENVALSAALNDNLFAEYNLFLADTHGSANYHEVSYTGKQMLILGGETASVPDHLKRSVQGRIHIPARGAGDSLNVSVAAGIILAQMVKEQNERT